MTTAAVLIALIAFIVLASSSATAADLRDWWAPTPMQHGDGDAYLNGQAADGQGTVTVAWVHSDGTRDNLLASRFVPDVGWVNTSLLETSEQNASCTAVRVRSNSAGVVAVSWAQCTDSYWNKTFWINVFVPGDGWQGPTFLGSENLSFAQRPVGIAVDSFGTVTAVWVGEDPDQYFDTFLWASRFVPGSGWGPTTLISRSMSNPTGYAEPDYIEVLAGPDGEATVVWLDDWAYGSINANRYVPAAGWGFATNISAEQINVDVIQLVAGIDSGGNVTAGWTEQHQCSPSCADDFFVLSNRYAVGSGWGTAQLVADSTASWSANPKLAVSPGGAAIILWTQITTSEAEVSAWTRRFDPSSGWGSPIRLSGVADGNHNSPGAVLIEDDGSALAAWTSDNLNGSYLWTKRFELASGWANATLIAAHNPGPLQYPSLQGDGEGRMVFLSWYQFVNGRWEIRSSTFLSADGWAAPGIFEPSQPNASYPFMAFEASGNATALWSHHDGTKSSIWTKRFAPAWNITLVTDPPGRVVVVAGVNRTTPYSFGCATSRLLDVPSPQEEGGIRFDFANWSDGGQKAHSTTCIANATLTARFDQTYLISFSTDPPGLDLLIDGLLSPGNSSFWWQAGSDHRVSAPALQTVGLARYNLSGWSDGAVPTRTLRVGEPLALKALFTPSEYRLRFDTAPLGLNLIVDGLPQAAPVTLWLAAGSSVGIEVPSPQLGPPGTRFRYSSWDDGGFQNHTVVANSATTLVARFSNEFAIELVSSPLDFELVVDGVAVAAPFSAWWAEGSSHSIGAPPSLAEVGEVRYGLISWRDVLATNRTLLVAGPEALEAIFAPAQFWVRIETNPPGGQVEVDGIRQTAPLGGWWNAGSTHDVAAPSPQSAGSTRFVFWAWSDNLGQAHSLEIRAPLTLVADFQTQHAARIDSSPPGMAVVVDGRAERTPFESWWNDGSSHTVGAPELSVVSSDTRAAWASWSDGGSRTHAFTVAAPMALSAGFVLQFLLLSESPFVLPQCDVADCWYANGTVARLSVNEIIAAGEGMRRAFSGWTGDRIDPNATTDILMDGPKRLNATWRLQYELRVEAAFGFTLGQGWHDAGATAHLILLSTNHTADGVTYNFAGWQGDVESQATELDIAMDSPKRVTIRWVAAPGPQGSLLTVVAEASLLAALTAGLVGVFSSRAGFALDGFVTVPLFTRLRKIDVTSQYQRGRIIQFIDDNPGASYSEIRRKLQIGNGGCAYHLRVLERNGEVRRVAHGASVRFYPPDYKVDPEARPPLSLMQRQVLELVLLRPDLTAADVRKALTDEGHSVNENTLIYNLKALAREKGLISSRREGGRTIYFTTAPQQAYLERRLKEEAAADRVLDQRLEANASKAARVPEPGAEYAAPGPAEASTIGQRDDRTHE